MADAFLLERITGWETLIISYEAALVALAASGAQTYTINTGQTNQTVQKLNRRSLQEGLDGAMNQRQILLDRCNNTGVTHAVPSL